MLLDPTINPFDAQAGAERCRDGGEPERDGERRCAGGAATDGEPAQDARAAGGHAGQALRTAAQPLREPATQALVPGLKTLLAQMSASLQAADGDASRPCRRTWCATGCAKDGTARIQVFPKDTSGIERGAERVHQGGDEGRARRDRRADLDPRVRHHHRRAFEQAGALSFVVITLLLLARAAARCAT